MRKNERTPTGTDVQNCLLGSVSGFILFIYFSYSIYCVGYIIKLEENANGNSCLGKNGTKYDIINKTVAYEVRCFNLKICC